MLLYGWLYHKIINIIDGQRYIVTTESRQNQYRLQIGLQLIQQAEGKLGIFSWIRDQRKPKGIAKSGEIRKVAYTCRYISEH